MSEDKPLEGYVMGPDGKLWTLECLKEWFEKTGRKSWVFSRKLSNKELEEITK